MRAFTNRVFGGPEVLKLEDLPDPEITEDEVLIRVRATSINSYDYDFLRGRPLAYRPLFGLFKPTKQILGADLSGVVEKVGSGVYKFKEGDEVYADFSPKHWGGFGEMTRGEEDLISLKPKNISFEEAASVPQAAVLAYQALTKYSDDLNDKHVLFNGGGGGIGTFGIQMAKQWGAKVTVVDKAHKLSKLKELGADGALDFTVQDFLDFGPYDIIVDIMTNRSIDQYLSVTNEKGAVVVVGGKTSALINMVSIGSLKAKRQGKHMSILAHEPNSEDLDKITTMIEEGWLKPVVDKVFSFDQLPESVEYFGKADFIGKVAVSISTSH